MKIGSILSLANIIVFMGLAGRPKKIFNEGAQDEWKALIGHGSGKFSKYEY